MTIAIALKVGDCLVLGADSASTLSGQDGSVLNVYFNAEKIINLRKGLPIGLVTYGLGNLARRSVTSLAKDLRRKLTGDDGAIAIDPSTYSMQQVAERVKEFFYDGLYRKEWPRKNVDDSGRAVEIWAPMGFLVAGYSAGQSEGEVRSVEVDQAGECHTRRIFGVGEYGSEVKGQPEAIYRLVNGWSPRILEGLERSGIPRQEALAFLQSQGAVPLVEPAMPLQDAIDLVKYLSDVTAGFMRFIPGAPTVHPPIDLAVISLHEGFRWVQRKHYYDAVLNPLTVQGGASAS